MSGRVIAALLAAWSMAMVAYYALTIAGNCGEPERDCGAAIGLGLLASAMIWTLGTGALLLIFWLIGRFSRRRRATSNESSTAGKEQR